ncbi:glycoside hydrolase family 16 protein [Crepidotus variabilis]|uniref:Glycoside hydrolase family 16 protein n=1 Tax=Crepidotus variabilis TaxID=179855 RepID=A0A9P6EF83_9AGAR|nr:glycoside hydrolase family 16 protein [Crepidotus variabilis]
MIPLALVPVLLAMLAGVANANATCNVTSPCSLSSAPCCSEFGFCGRDNFCLGGCNPYASKGVNSCRPEPLCKDSTYTFADKSRILSNSTLFDGNSTKYDWVIDKGSVLDNSGNIALTLADASGGTRISSTKYVHYGDITATIKTGRWNGVVTAFITMSDIKDEIDWEFPGSKTTQGQSNFFWQGLIPTTKTNGATHDGISDTFANFHDYTVSWGPDQLSWSVDGNVVRTVKKSDTYDAAGVPHYPSTPSRIQLSIWPAGVEGSPPGTVDWAGGMINWDDPDFKAAGHFYAIVQKVTVKCINAQVIDPAANITSYIYSGNSSSNPSIVYSNYSTMVNGARSMLPVAGLSGTVLTAFVMGLLMALNAMLL